MTAIKSRPEPLSPGQATMVFEAIACTASTLDGVLSILEGERAEDEADRAALTAAAVMLNQRIGLLAELYGERCGELRPTLVKGSTDAWLLPERFKEG